MLNPSIFVRILLASVLTVVLIGVGPCPGTGPQSELPGLSTRVTIQTDEDGVRHLTARDDLDLARAMGWVHCRDRLFQMDQTRRQVDGTESELLGVGRLSADIQARVVGLVGDPEAPSAQRPGS